MREGEGKRSSVKELGGGGGKSVFGDELMVCSMWVPLGTKEDEEAVLDGKRWKESLNVHAVQSVHRGICQGKRHSSRLSSCEESTTRE